MMKLALIIIWLILFPWSSMIMLPPRLTSDSNPWDARSVFGFLLLWPLGVLAWATHIGDDLRWWQTFIENRGLKSWHIALGLVALPVLMIGLLDGHGDVGSFRYSIALAAGAIGNLLLWVQVLKYYAIM